MIERVILPSRIRRGRLATTPVWRAEHNGRRMQFQRKRDAVVYQAQGCPQHESMCCRFCGGVLIEPWPREGGEK